MARLASVAVLALSMAAGATAGQVDLPLQFGGAFSVPATSVREARQAATIRQRFDFSCGAAALATLLTHHYGVPTTEQQAFDEMFRLGDEARIRESGFSMLDMKRFLAARGLSADGFDAPLDTLAQAGAPAIVLVDQGGYHHFVVVKGVQHGRVLFGDPAQGTRVLPREAFDALRVGSIVFVVTDRPGRFNDAGDWRARPVAPLAGHGREGQATSPWLRLERSDL